LNKRQNQRAQRLVNETKIGFGEAEALVKAVDKKLLLIVDDKEARAITKSWGFGVHGHAPDPVRGVCQGPDQL
jgi:predicted nucleic acid-binding protein